MVLIGVLKGSAMGEMMYGVRRWISVVECGATTLCFLQPSFYVEVGWSSNSCYVNSRTHYRFCTSDSVPLKYVINRWFAQSCCPSNHPP